MPLNINDSNKRDTLASADINRNLKNIKKDRHINVKIFAVIVLLLIGWFVYSIITSPPPPIPSIPTPQKPFEDSIPKDDSPKMSSPVIDKTTVTKPDEDKQISVSGSDLTSLRIKLLSKSERLMAGGEYTPVNLRLNPATNSFSCKLIKKRSGFIKLSLVWGPSGNCESCDNSISRNPGSQALLSNEFGGVTYQITAIPE
jgi:hypothetical protein